MEFLDGETLTSRIRRSGRLSLGSLSEIGRQISNVLEATHQAGITHRDLKPDNVFLVSDAEMDSGERVKVLDFGIAKLGGTGLTGTSVGSMGTPGYMAPEQWHNSRNVDWRADAYSLGCLAFEMAAGRPPFVAQSIAEACTKHLTETPVAIRSLVPELPIALESLLARLLEKAAAKRPATMKEITQTFASLGRGQPGALDATLGSNPVEVAATVATGISQATTRASGQPIGHVVAPQSKPVAPRPLPTPAASTTLGSATVASTTTSDPARRRKGSRLMLSAICVTLVAAAVISVLIVTEHSNGVHTDDRAAAPAANNDATTRAIEASVFPDSSISDSATSPDGARAPELTGKQGIAAAEVRHETAPETRAGSKHDTPVAHTAANGMRETRPSNRIEQPGSDGHPPSKPAPRSGAAERAVSPTAPTDPAPPPSDTQSCDEVSCDLNNNEGACCAKFKKSGGRAPSGGGGTAQPAGAKADLPESLDRAMISDGVAKVKARVMSCGDKSTAKGQVKVSVKVGPDGQVTAVTVKNTPDAGLGNCVASMMQKATFIKTQSGGSFSYPYTF
jgi:serine/threonine-protein kinase